MDSADTFVFIFAIVDGMSLLFLTVYFVSLNVYELISDAFRCRVQNVNEC